MFKKVECWDKTSTCPKCHSDFADNVLSSKTRCPHCNYGLYSEIALTESEEIPIYFIEISRSSSTC